MTSRVLQQADGQPDSQLVLKCKRNCFFFFSFLLSLLFRSPAERLATGWLPRMQREKRLRGNTFCEDPDSGADSHGRRSVSSR